MIFVDINALCSCSEVANYVLLFNVLCVDFLGDSEVVNFVTFGFGCVLGIEGACVGFYF